MLQVVPFSRLWGKSCGEAAVAKLLTSHPHPGPLEQQFPLPWRLLPGDCGHAQVSLGDDSALDRPVLHLDRHGTAVDRFQPDVPGLVEILGGVSVGGPMEI